MSRPRINIVHIITVAASAAIISCGGAKTTSSQARPQGDEQSQTAKEEQPQRPARAARQQQAASAAPTSMTAADLRSMRTSLMGLNIPVGFASAKAASESEAMAAALDSARADLARWTGVQTHRFSETYARNVPEASRKRWEERVALMSDGAVRNAPAFKSAIENDRANRIVRVHVLVVYDPVQYKRALGDAMAGNDEFNRRAQKDRMQKKMDAIIADFNSKYRR